MFTRDKSLLIISGLCIILFYYLYEYYDYTRGKEGPGPFQKTKKDRRTKFQKPPSFKSARQKYLWYKSAKGGCAPATKKKQKPAKQSMGKNVAAKIINHPKGAKKGKGVRGKAVRGKSKVSKI